MKKTIALFLVIAACLFGKTNLVQSLGTENGIAGQHLEKVTGWYGPKNIASYSDDIPQCLPYSKSVCLDFTDAPQKGGNWCLSNASIKLEPGKSYRLSMWLKTEGLKTGYGSTCGFYYFDGNGKSIAGSDYPYDKAMRGLYVHKGPLSWQYFSLDLKPVSKPQEKYTAGQIPPGTAGIGLLIGAFNYPGKIWFTQPILEELRLGDSKPHPGDGKVVPVNSPEYRTDFVKVICPFDKSHAVADKAGFAVASDDTDFIIKGYSIQPKDRTTARASGKNSPAIWGEDYFDLAFDPTGTKAGNLFKFAISPQNCVFSQWRNHAYTYEYECKTEQLEDRWSFELRIPKLRIKQLCDEAGLALSSTDWDFNIAREWKQGGEARYIGWCQSERTFQNTENMGKVIFADMQQALSAHYASDLSKLAKQETEYAGVLKNTSDIPKAEQLRQTLLEAFNDFKTDAKAVQEMSSISLEDFALLYRRTIAMAETINDNLVVLKRMAFGAPEKWSEFGFVPWQMPLFALPNRDMIPDVDKASSEFEFQAPLESHGDLQLAFFPFREIKNMKWSITDLTSDSGDTIPATDITLRALALYDDIGTTLNGWLLVSNPNIPIAKMSTGDFTPDVNYGDVAPYAPQFLYIKAMSGSKPGTYRGLLKASATGQPEAIINITLKVLPINLEEPGKKYGFFYLGVLDKGQPATDKVSPYSGGCTPQAMEFELRKLYNDGCRIITLYCYTTGPLNPDYAREVMTIARNVGFREVIILGAEHLFTRSYNNEPEELEKHLKLLTERLVGIKAIGQELGFDKVYIYSIDEALSEEQLARLTKFSDAVHAVGMDTACALIFDMARKAAEHRTDLVMMSWRTASNEDFGSEFNQALRSGGSINHKHAYYYPILGNTPHMDRLVFGCYLYKSKYEGCFPWSWYEFQVAKKPSLKTVRYVLQTADGGIISSLRYEAALAGIQDMQLIRTLEKKQTGKERLEQILKPIELDNANGVLDAMKPDTFENIRSEIYKAILEQ